MVQARAGRSHHAKTGRLAASGPAGRLGEMRADHALPRQRHPERPAMPPVVLLCGGFDGYGSWRRPGRAGVAFSSLPQTPLRLEANAHCRMGSIIAAALRQTALIGQTHGSFEGHRHQGSRQPQCDFGEHDDQEQDQQHRGQNDAHIPHDADHIHATNRGRNQQA